MNKYLPPFLEHVTLTKRERTILTNALTNWKRCLKFLTKRKHTVELMEKLMYLEMTKELPRGGVILKLAQRYNSARRNESMVLITKFINQDHVVQIAVGKRGVKKQSPQQELDLDESLREGNE